MLQSLNKILGSHHYRSLGKKALRIHRTIDISPPPSPVPPFIPFNYTIIDDIIEQPFYSSQLRQLSVNFLNKSFNENFSPTIYTDSSLKDVSTE